MEKKKTLKADLETKRLLFVEIGLALALAVVYGAFEYSSVEISTAELVDSSVVLDDDFIIPATFETPPPPPPAVPKIELSDIIDIVDDDIEVDDNLFKTIEDDPSSGIEIYDYYDVVEVEVDEAPIPFAIVEQKPKFNGGDANEFSRWVNKRLVYPQICVENGVQGRVTLSFTVMPDGSLANISVLRGVDKELDKEALRVVSSSPRWEPGRQRDRAVPVTYTFPVIFSLR
ncbi:MAG: energy transducer TonB [Bacteroidales bacterium]|jgi:protein TonB|nr:energy transducer TonB [Bacteroidales bacterium]